MESLTDSPPSLDGPGRSEGYWRGCRRLAELPRWLPALPPSGRVVVVAPHPDDEILGAGGTVARLAAQGARVRFVAVTDGERSHPGRSDWLRAVRPAESAAALVELGVPDEQSETVRLCLADGAVHDAPLTGMLSALIEPGDLILAAWSNDGHPDHDAVGRAATSAAGERGAQLREYLVWAWHWASYSGIPWARAERVELGPKITARKCAAVRCFPSQIEGPAPILAPGVLDRFTRPFEILLGP